MVVVHDVRDSEVHKPGPERVGRVLEDFGHSIDAHNSNTSNALGFNLFLPDLSKSLRHSGKEDFNSLKFLTSFVIKGVAYRNGPVAQNWGSSRLRVGTDKIGRRTCYTLAQ